MAFLIWSNYENKVELFFFAPKLSIALSLSQNPLFITWAVQMSYSFCAFVCVCEWER